MTNHNKIDNHLLEKLKSIIRKLHEGKSEDKIKKEFTGLLKKVDASGIALLEQSLIDEGMPAEEIQRLCDVHVNLFRQGIKKKKAVSKIPGHPVHTFIAENKEALKRIAHLLKITQSGIHTKQEKEKMEKTFRDFSLITKHYTRKENQLFPFLEKKGFTGPSKVMWGKHDEIRGLIKEAEQELQKNSTKFSEIMKTLASAVKKMIFMEEHILLPNAVAKLDEKDWAEIRTGENAIGYSWITPGAQYDMVIAATLTKKTASSKKVNEQSVSSENISEKTDMIELDTGRLSVSLLNNALKNLSVDISIVDPDDKVLYYSDSPDRIFPRSPGVIGRDVRNCHPQKSVAIVEKILNSFKSGEKKEARFWIKLNGKFIVIEYRALFDQHGEYLGTLEISQDVMDIRLLEGEKRLLDW